MARPPRIGGRRPRTPGWYDDPWRVARRRWWDGERWTSRVADPLDLSVPTEPPAPRSHRRRARPVFHERRSETDGAAARASGRGASGRTASPFAADAPRTAFVAVVAGAPATFILLVVAQQVLPGRPVGEAGAFLALWGAAFAAVVRVSRRHGTGHIGADAGFLARPVDAIGGVGVALLLVQVHAVVVRLVAGTVTGGLGPRSGFVTPPYAQPAALVAVTAVLTAFVGPIAEELLFRGVVQPALASRVHPSLAIVGQAIIAGLCHANPGLGLHTFSVVAAWTAGALVLGVARELTGRLGPGLFGHSLYQVLVVTAVLRGA